MEEIDRVTIEEYGIPSIVLMENAGVKTVLAMEKIIENLTYEKVLVVVGSGNNGGDGLVIARHLHNRGVSVTINILTKEENLKKDPLINFNIIKKMKLNYKFINEDNITQFSKDVKNYTIIVDSIFGIGLSTDIKGLKGEVIKIINGTKAKKIAVDIPSGVCSDSGKILKYGIMADITITMGIPKAGLFIYPAVGYRGKLFIADIGIPLELLNNGRNKTILDKKYIKSLIPDRKIDGNKGRFGHILVVGGSNKYSGAPIMTILGGLKSGAGLATLASTKTCLDLMTIKIPEAIRYELCNDDFITSVSINELIKNNDLKKFVLAIGVGLGRDKKLLKSIRELFNVCKRGVLDADGLYSLISEGKIENGSEKLITPHPGEAASLLECDISEINNNRIKSAEKLRDKYGVNVLLKGIGTIIATLDGKLFINSTGNSSLSKGGSGDVLTGIIASFVAQGLNMVDASTLAAYLHGLTGENLGSKFSDYSVLATEIADNIGVSINNICK